METSTIDRYNQEKLYIQLMRIFLEEVTSGRWRLGEQIPTENELCEAYLVSKITVRQAINNLVSDGYLVKLQGKGTFVTSVLPVVGVAMKTRLTEEMFGKEVEAQRDVLSKGISDPSRDVRAYLKTDESVVKIVTRRSVGGKTAFVEESFIPSSMLEDDNGLNVGSGSLYAFLQERAKKKIFKVIQTVEVSAMTEDLAGALGVKAGSPVLVVHRLLLSSDNTPVAYTRLQGRSDRYKLQTEFERIR